METADTAQTSQAVVVHEIYASIQGESTFAGRPCTFVRLSGCNLRCVWCDTPQAFVAGTRRTQAEVVAEALAFGTPLIELTGGEPLLQPGAFELLRQFCDAGRTVLLETSGERDITDVDPRVHRIIDLKAPASGEESRNRWANLLQLRRTDEIKVVIADRGDYEWARAILHKHSLHQKVNAVLFSPVFGVLDAKKLVEWILEDQLPVRFQLQLHKHIWHPDAQGV